MMQDAMQSPWLSFGTAPYEILILGELDDRWSEWFHGVEILLEAHRSGTKYTRLKCPAIDQVRLRGILNKIWDMNLLVISVNRRPVRLPERQTRHESENSTGQPSIRNGER
jgi:hypothetical protein